MRDVAANHNATLQVLCMMHDRHASERYTGCYTDCKQQPTVVQLY